MGKWKKLNSNKEKEIRESRFLADWSRPCRSKFQKTVKDQLHDLFPVDVFLEEFPVPGSRMTIDLINLTKNWAIEVQGFLHEEYNPHFHRNNVCNFLGQLKRDDNKRKWCVANNLLLIEVFPESLPLSYDFFLKEYGLEI